MTKDKFAVEHLKKDLTTERIVLIHTGSFNFSGVITTLKSFLVLLVMLLNTTVYGQPGGQDSEDAAYKKVITERVAKILLPLEINDPAKHDKVLSIVVNQYIDVNTIQDGSKKKTSEIKASSSTKEEKEAEIKALNEKKAKQLMQQHKEFIGLLKNNLTDAQIDKIKDGMTYSVFPKTYGAYLEMIPSLTQGQKDKIYNWLKEARELAMDEGSSEKKHAVFGKYKGRINNYLSAEGYDMKKEEAGWQQRIKEKNNQSVKH